MKKFDALKEYINIKNVIKIRAYGKSMLPAIKEGDTITINKNIDNLKYGDIILYYNPSNQDDIYVLHRIISSVKDNMFLTKGDNNRYVDQPVRKSYIIGKAILIIPKKE